MFSFGYARGRPRSSKPKKKRKAKKDNWFEKLTLDQLKQLCTAVKAPVSGTKPAVVQRLLSNESSKEYAYEPQRISWRAYANYSYDSCDDGSGPGGGKPDGPCAETIKSRVREAGLSVTGNKFELVLRLMQHLNGVGNPKRGAVHVNEEGECQPKKRAKSMALPDADKMYERVAKKVDIDFHKASDWTLKYHAHDVMMLINKLAQQEVMDKQLVSRGEPDLAWSVCENLASPSLPEEGHSFQASPCYSWERVEDYMVKEFGDLLHTLAQQTKQHCDAATLATLAEQHTGWIRDFAAMQKEADAGPSALEGYRTAIALLNNQPLPDPVPRSPAASSQQDSASVRLLSPPTAVKQQAGGLGQRKVGAAIDFLQLASRAPVPVPALGALGALGGDRAPAQEEAHLQQQQQQQQQWQQWQLSQQIPQQ